MSAAREGYEKRDASPRSLVISGLALALLIAASLAVCAWIEQKFADPLQIAQGTNPLESLRTRPPGPQLEPRPAAELARQREWEEQQLGASGWIDPVNKIVRIPIEAAIELGLREGFPTRSSPAPAAPAKKGEK